MFKMSSYCLHASLEALAPLGNSTVDYTLIQTIPHFQQALLQIVYIMDCYLVDSLLHNARRLYSRQDLDLDCSEAITLEKCLVSLLLAFRWFPWVCGLGHCPAEIKTAFWG